MSQEEVPLEGKIGIVASPKAADLLFKAVKQAIAEYPEANDFQIQNPAAKRLINESDQAFDIMMDSLVIEVEKVLGS